MEELAISGIYTLFAASACTSEVISIITPRITLGCSCFFDLTFVGKL
jgi:hypothetical protein